MTLKDKIAIITGASSGIGRATAIAMARRGARLVLAARNAAALRGLEEEIRSIGADVLVQPTDVSDRNQVDALAHETLRRFGRVDIVVCSAGEYVRGAVHTLAPEQFERAMRVNFFGTLELVLAVLPVMRQQRSGTIVVVSSVDGKKGLPLDAPYVASKFAVTGFMDVLRQELHGTGVHAVTVLPARVDTPMIEHLHVPWLSRKISCERVARTIVRGIRFGGTEMIVPFGGPTFLVVLQSLSPRAADLLTRLFKLEGVERQPA